jgi:hypothetical protein
MENTLTIQPEIQMFLELVSTVDFDGNKKNTFQRMKMLSQLATDMLEKAEIEKPKKKKIIKK